MKHVPDLSSAEYQEGMQAAAELKHFARVCPYTFDRFGGSVREFEDAGWRVKLNNWFAGWQAGLEANALKVGHGFVVKPITAAPLPDRSDR